MWNTYKDKRQERKKRWGNGVYWGTRTGFEIGTSHDLEKNRIGFLWGWFHYWVVDWVEKLNPQMSWFYFLRYVSPISMSYFVFFTFDFYNFFHEPLFVVVCLFMVTSATSSVFIKSMYYLSLYLHNNLYTCRYIRSSTSLCCLFPFTSQYYCGRIKKVLLWYSYYIHKNKALRAFKTKFSSYN